MKKFYENAVLQGYWFEGIEEKSKPRSLEDCTYEYRRIFDNMAGHNRARRLSTNEKTDTLGMFSEKEAYAAKRFFETYYRLQEKAQKQGDYFLLEAMIYIFYGNPKGYVSIDEWNVLTDVFSAINDLEQCEELMRAMRDRSYMSAREILRRSYMGEDVIDVANAVLGAEIPFLKVVLASYKNKESTYENSFSAMPFEWQLDFVANELEIEKTHRKPETSRFQLENALSDEQEFINVITANRIVQSFQGSHLKYS